LTVNGPALADNDHFGSAVAALGDIDRDGVTDLAVGAQGDDTGGAPGANRGAVYILLMNADGSVKSSSKVDSLTPTGPVLANGDSFGSSIASPGDLDGDGVSDLAVGASGSATNRGAVHVLFL